MRASRIWVLVLGLFVMSGFLSFSYSPALAATNDQVFGVCDPSSPNYAKIKNSSFCKDQTKTDNPVVHVINVTANILALLAGIIAVFILMIGGLRFITAGGVKPGQRSGDPNKVAQARSQIMYALVGIIIIALAWTITRFVTDKVIK